MPFSNELGMRVYDPTEGENYGLRQGQMFTQAYQNAKNRQISERHVKLLEDEVAAKAKATLRRNIGLSNMKNRAQELFSSMEQNPMNWALAQKQAFLENASDIIGEGSANVIPQLLNSEEANQVRLNLGEALTQQKEKANQLQGQIKLHDLFAKTRENEWRRRLEYEKEQGRNQRAQARIEATTGTAEKREERMSAKDRQAALAKIEKDEDLAQLRQEAKVARRGLDDIDKQRWWVEAHKTAAKAKAQENVRLTQAAVEKKRKELMAEYGLEEPTVTTEPGDSTTTKRLRWTGEGFEPATTP